VSTLRVVALSGGVGGAKLLRGFYRVLPPDSLAAIVNTGDDFAHLGLRICPDVDTALYTLGDLANAAQGWGRRDETWTFMRVLKDLGGESWFALGDGDLALHVVRTLRLAQGENPSAIIGDFARNFGIAAQILPMSDDPVATRVVTDAGELAFQDYFVRLHCEPKLRSLHFAGADTATLLPAARAALSAPGLEAIVIAPSNPYLSIDPILAVPGMRDVLKAAAVPVIAVTPVPGGKAVKGPTAKIMGELGIAVTGRSVAEHYRGLIDGILLDESDRSVAHDLDIPVEFADTLMPDEAGSERVANAVLAFARRLGGQKRGVAVE
jgi:LPPG:FO 2-phospho-L-lactate transferase